MKRTLGLITLLAMGALTLSGCNKNAPVEDPDKNAEIPNPAAVYCEENGGTLNLEEWLCIFEDGSYCEEWAYQRWECQPGEIMYNSIEDGFIDGTEQKTDWNGSSEIYSDEELQSAVDTIMNEINNEWKVKVEMQELSYAGDEESANNLEYCQSLKSELEGCAVFTSSFHIPDQDVEMAWAFEPNTDIDGWSWILGKNSAGEWEILTNGFG